MLGNAVEGMSRHSGTAAAARRSRCKGSLVRHARIESASTGEASHQPANKKYMHVKSMLQSGAAQSDFCLGGTSFRLIALPRILALARSAPHCAAPDFVRLNRQPSHCRKQNRARSDPGGFFMRVFL
jgi:hypothetical protein